MNKCFFWVACVCNRVSVGCRAAPRHKGSPPHPATLRRCQPHGRSPSPQAAKKAKQKSAVALESSSDDEEEAAAPAKPAPKKEGGKKKDRRKGTDFDWLQDVEDEEAAAEAEVPAHGNGGGTGFAVDFEQHNQGGGGEVHGLPSIRRGVPGPPPTTSCRSQ